LIFDESMFSTFGNVGKVKGDLSGMFYPLNYLSYQTSY